MVMEHTARKQVVSTEHRKLEDALQTIQLEQSLNL